MMNKQNTFVRNFVWGVVFIIVLILTANFRNSESRKHVNVYELYKPKEYITNTKSKTYTGVSNKDSVYVKVEDKLTGEQEHYKVDGISTYVKQMADQTIPNMSSTNKNYLKQNSGLVSDASKAYGFIFSNNYKTVKFCSQHYPVNNLKKQFDLRFKDKKTKAINILNNALGKNGAQNLEQTLMSNTNLLHISYKQVEDDYMMTMRLATQEGIHNFTKKDYCRMLDDAAVEIVDEEYIKFKTILPNF